jgi:pimeloyl-ACP methyl ester carboxylesterase
MLAVALLLLAYNSLAKERMPNQAQPLAPGQHYAQVNAVSICYNVAGSGPLLIIQAPGWGIGSSYLLNGLAPLAQHHTVLVYDTRGSGQSSRPTDAKRMSTADMVDDLEQLRKFWGLDSMTLLGHSHGGAIALSYAALYPQRVRRLVLVDSSIQGYDSRSDIKREIDARRNDKRFAEAIAESGKNSPPQTDAEFAAGLGRVMPLYFYDPANVPRFQKTMPGLPSLWAMHAYSAAENDKEIAAMGRVRARTLILVGRSDFICSPPIAERIQAGVRKSKLVVIEKSGHFPWIEAPEEFFPQVTRFVGK